MSSKTPDLTNRGSNLLFLSALFSPEDGSRPVESSMVACLLTQTPHEWRPLPCQGWCQGWRSWKLLEGSMSWCLVKAGSHTSFFPAPYSWDGTWFIPLTCSWPPLGHQVPLMASCSDECLNDTWSKRCFISCKRHDLAGILLCAGNMRLPLPACTCTRCNNHQRAAISEPWR